MGADPWWLRGTWWDEAGGQREVWGQAWQVLMVFSRAIVFYFLKIFKNFIPLAICTLAINAI